MKVPTMFYIDVNGDPLGSSLDPCREPLLAKGGEQKLLLAGKLTQIMKKHLKSVEPEPNRCNSLDGKIGAVKCAGGLATAAIIGGGCGYGTYEMAACCACDGPGIYGVFGIIPGVMTGLCAVFGIERAHEKYRGTHHPKWPDITLQEAKELDPNYALDPEDLKRIAKKDWPKLHAKLLRHLDGRQAASLLSNLSPENLEQVLKLQPESRSLFWRCFVDLKDKKSAEELREALADNRLQEVLLKKPDLVYIIEAFSRRDWLQIKEISTHLVEARRLVAQQAAHHPYNPTVFSPGLLSFIFEGKTYFYRPEVLHGTAEEIPLGKSLVLPMADWYEPPETLRWLLSNAHAKYFDAFKEETNPHKIWTACHMSVRLGMYKISRILQENLASLKRKCTFKKIQCLEEFLEILKLDLRTGLRDLYNDAPTFPFASRSIKVENFDVVKQVVELVTENEIATVEGVWKSIVYALVNSDDMIYWMTVAEDRKLTEFAEAYCSNHLAISIHNYDSLRVIAARNEGFRNLTQELDKKERWFTSTLSTNFKQCWKFVKYGPKTSSLYTQALDFAASHRDLVYAFWPKFGTVPQELKEAIEL